MKQIIFTTILLLVFCFSADSQTNDSVCPANFAVFPQGIVNPDETVKIGIDLGEDATKSNVKYEWTISAGIIVKGQGASEIEIATSREMQGSNIIVSVKTGGLPKECVVSDVFAIAQILEGEPFDQFGKIDLYSYLARLDALFYDVARNTDNEGLIIIRFNRQDSRKHKKARLQSIRKHFILRKLDASLVTIAVSEDESEEQTTFWLASPRAESPINVRDYTIIKAEDLGRRINELFPKK